MMKNTMKLVVITAVPLFTAGCLGGGGGLSGLFGGGNGGGFFGFLGGGSGDFGTSADFGSGSGSDLSVGGEGESDGGLLGGSISSFSEYVGVIDGDGDGYEGGIDEGPGVTIVNPEPASMALFGGGLAGLALWRRRKSRTT